MSKTYIIGHKNPDTDSIASSLAYAELKQKQGFNVEARRLGTLNEETKYAIKYFDTEAPDLLKDARCRLKDIELDKVIEINKEDSCNDAFKKVIETSNRTLFVTDNHKLLGILSISDLTSIRLMNTSQREALLAKSNLELITSDLQGELLNKDTYDTNGSVHVYRPNRSFQKHIVLVDNENSILEILEHKPSLVILSKNEISDKTIEECQKYHISLIRTSMYIENILRIIYEAIPCELVMSKEMKTFNSNEFVDDVSGRVISTRFRCYPVVDEDNIIIGTISRYHLFNYQKNKFILVDHSSTIQTIDNINSAEIIEIVDHHHIGDVQTSVPINYRNQTCGSTSTIIYQMFKENNIAPSRQIAGMMVSAIISDTLCFISNTTTPLDIKSAEELSQYLNIDLYKYAKQLLSASVNLNNADINELIKRDLKQYTFNGYKVAIGQTNYYNISDVQKRVEEVKKAIIEYQTSKKLDLLVMLFTSVKADGSYFVFSGLKSNAIIEIIENKFDEHTGYDSEILSRKQQLVPKLSKILEQY